MDDFKDFFYAGLGAALVTKEKIEKELEELKEKGKGGKEEFKQKYEEAKTKAKAFEEEFDGKLKEKVRKVLLELGVATKEDVEELRKLIEGQNK
jgi:polyhydroxyalkanoate synthesis regulator phasin